MAKLPAPRLALALLLAVAVAVARAQEPRAWLPKCCPRGQVPGGYGPGCSASPVAALFAPPPVFGDPASPPLDPSSPEMPEIVVRMLRCPAGKYFLEPGRRPEDRFQVLLNGSLFMPVDAKLHAPEDYCIEYDADENRTVPTLCFIDEGSRVILTVYPVGMIISLPFLVATFVVYAVIRELRNLHGKNVMSHVFSLLIGYIALTSSQLAPPDLAMKTCVILGISIQFGFLATFFWLNVMCFDIWWTFSGLRKPGGSAKETERKKFIMYSCYAWGCPLIVLIITVIMDHTKILDRSNPFKPNMGESKCFFDTREASWLYFYGPMCVLLISNILMFATTARHILRHTRETAVLTSNDSKRHNSDKERFYLYLKLFLVMGINWITELISWIAGGPDEVWYITDITNTLQGLFIFIIFVCKKRVLRLLNNRLCPSVKMWGTGASSAETSNVTQRTSNGNHEDSLQLRGAEEA